MSGIHDSYIKIAKEIATLNSKATLVLVTKTHPATTIEALYQWGQRDFGENYVQELVEKNQVLLAKGLQELRWHFVGKLQRNKIKKILETGATLHSVDSLEVAADVNAKGLQMGMAPISIFVQVNISNETTKAGLEPDEVPIFLKKIQPFKNLKVLGLMCIPSPQQPAAKAFKAMQELSRETRALHEGQLSMGMSADYREALQFGATHVRIGQAILGTRRKT